MRIRPQFAAAFFVLGLIATYAGLTPLNFDSYVNNKFLHLTTFFVLTLTFYWIVDTHRRRALNLTLVVCTASLGVGAEFVQGVFSTSRNFDISYIVANVIGSGGAVALCSWYHGRMLDRRRQRRNYDVVPGEDDEDLELGEDHETGVIDNADADSPVVSNLEQQVDNWDENAEDNWDDEEEDDVGLGTVSGAKTEEPIVKKRTD
ncbi:hypothetical protein Cpir12675_005333 [Ceratocystis pirilliformis]|uniref:VanZ-like domain-containing protein n=1 Tax=Ceratocystis pirilliformis TaxID=259994 RepID=A0ABR3YRV3_9PEZI